MSSVLLLMMLALLIVGAGIVVVAAMASRTGSAAIAKRVDKVAAFRIVRPQDKMVMAHRLAAAEEFFQALFSFRKTPKWGTHSHSPILLVIGLLCGTSVWMITHTTLGLPSWIAMPLAIGAFLLGPHYKLSREQNATEARFTDHFPDAIDSIIRMLRAGLPISAAVRAVAAEPSPPVDAVFQELADQMDIGVPLDKALAIAGQRIHIADFRFFTVAVGLQHATGGNLTTTLDILSEIIRKRRAMRLKAKAVTSEVRMSAYVLAAIPLVIVAGLLVINPGYLSPLIDDPRGKLIILAAIGSLTTGFLIMRLMMSRAVRV